MELEVLFSRKMINYTLVFKKVTRPAYGTGCDIQKKLIKYRSDLVFCIPEANECFRKNMEIIHQEEFMYQKGFSQEEFEFIKQSVDVK